MNGRNSLLEKTQINRAGVGLIISAGGSLAEIKGNQMKWADKITYAWYGIKN